MENLLGLGSALAAMRRDDGRYASTLMLSGLPQAPVVPARHPRARVVRALLPRRRRPIVPARHVRAASGEGCAPCATANAT